MATLTVDRHFVQRSLLDPHEEDRDRRLSPPPVDPIPATPAAPAPAAAPSTLDDLVSGVWDELVASHSAACLMCGGEVEPRWAAGPRPVGGRCTSCHTEIA